MVRNPSGEGGDVELGARTSEKFLVFAFGLLSLALALHSLHLLLALYCHCYIHLFLFILSIKVSYNKIALCTSNSFQEESRGRSSEPFIGHSASNLVLGDCCIIFLNCALISIITYSPPLGDFQLVSELGL